MFTSLSGRPKRNSLSKRPGLLRAGSMESSLFVAPITTTSPLLSNPSIRARRVDTIELQMEKKKEKNILNGNYYVFSEKKEKCCYFRFQMVLWIYAFRN